jgi:transcriptional regulator with XRE-family HTH domain
MAWKWPYRGDAIDDITKRYKLDMPRHWAVMAEDHANVEVSMMVYALRTAARLTQAELARRVGTAPSAISRLEDAEYRGHSLAMLRRIAEAVGMQVVVRFEPAGNRTRPGWILDRTQRAAVRSSRVAEKAPGAQGPRRSVRRPRPVRRSAKQAG